MTLSIEKCAAWMNRAAELLAEQADYLTDLDRQIGDADHGLNMKRGFQAVVELDAGKFDDPGSYLKKVGMTLVSKVGGASGPLYGTFFMRAGGALSKLEDVPAATAFTQLIASGLGGVQQRGKAEIGEKTMVDAWAPALVAAETAAENAGDDLVGLLGAVLAAAEAGAEKTVNMVATKGRASYLGERSRGTMDPGAASTVLLLQAAKEAMS